jgi:hypothetical protein
MLGWLEWRWLRGIYSPQPPNNRWGWAAVDGRTGQSDVPLDTVRCASHITKPFRVWAQSTIGALSSCGTGQSGAAPDRYCSLSSAPLTAAQLCRALFAHCSSGIQLFQATIARSSRCSAGSPDSLVAHWTVQ